MTPLFVGISFPFRKGATSFPEKATDVDLIKQSLTQLILTGRGERVMRPDVGSDVYSYIFESDDLLLLQRAEADIQSLITRFEPRVGLLGVSVTRAAPNAATTDMEAATVTITVTYVILSTRQVDQLSVDLSNGGGI